MPSRHTTATTEASNAPAEASLLRLPAELRNEVYRLALIQPRGRYTRVNAGTAWAAEPPILHVCRQIRNEAIAIYYRENLFWIEARDCDATNLIKWRGMSKHRCKANICPCLYGMPSWTNLKRWLQAYYHGRAPRVRANSSAEEPHHIAVAKVFDFVLHMRERDRFLNWGKIEAALEKVHDVMVALDPAWK